jgi:hypothetical protein
MPMSTACPARKVLMTSTPSRRQPAGRHGRECLHRPWRALRARPERFHVFMSLA